MNALIVFTTLVGLATYASAGVVSTLGYASPLAIGAPIAIGGTDLAGAIGIAQGQRDAYLGRVAAAQGAAVAAQAQAVNVLNRVAVATPNGIAVTDLTGAVGIAQGQRDAYLGRVAAAQGAAVAAHAQAVNVINRGIPIGAAGILGVPALAGQFIV